MKNNQRDEDVFESRNIPWKTEGKDMDHCKTLEEADKRMKECEEIYHEINLELENARNNNRVAEVLSTIALILGVVSLTIGILSAR